MPVDGHSETLSFEAMNDMRNGAILPIPKIGF